MQKAKIGAYTYMKSTRRGKKLMTVVDGKQVHFGQIGYQHFKDATGLLPKSQNHGDQKRRQNYLTRTAKIKNKKGQLTKDLPSSPNFHARKILWAG
jgi:hypothetical protein